jgi:hypothetical protein
MKFVAAFAGTTMLPVDFDHGGINATAYAARRADGKVMVAILNKDETQPMVARVGACRLDRVLTAPSLQAREADILTGHQAEALVSVEGGLIRLPKATAAMITLE